MRRASVLGQMHWKEVAESEQKVEINVFVREIKECAGVTPCCIEESVSRNGCATVRAEIFVSVPTL